MARDEGVRWLGRQAWGPNQGGNLISVAAKTLPDHATSANANTNNTNKNNATPRTR